MSPGWRKNWGKAFSRPCWEPCAGLRASEPLRGGTWVHMSCSSGLLWAGSFCNCWFKLSSVLGWQVKAAEHTWKEVTPEPRTLRPKADSAVWQRHSTSPGKLCPVKRSRMSPHAWFSLSNKLWREHQDNAVKESGFPTEKSARKPCPRKDQL